MNADEVGNVIEALKAGTMNHDQSPEVDDALEALVAVTERHLKAWAEDCAQRFDEKEWREPGFDSAKEYIVDRWGGSRWQEAALVTLADDEDYRASQEEGPWVTHEGSMSSLAFEVAARYLREALTG